MLPQEAVVAGSPEFVDALLPLVTQRLGGAPRVADTPHLASALCQDGARLLVYEHGGREWLSLCSALRGAAGPELIVVVALPPEHAGDVAEISAAASAVVAWRGEAGPVVEAISRVTAAREASRVPAPARRAGPILTPQPAPVAVRPAPTPPPPAATPRPRPVMQAARTPAATPDPRPPPARPSPTPAPVPVPAGGDEESTFESIFDDDGAPEVPAAPPERSDVPAAPPPSMPTSVWPGTVLSATDGLAVVRAALSGLWPEQRLRPVTEKLVAALSTAEKASALGQKLPFDPAPVRRAIGLRWQVAAAIETLPPMGAQVDQGAVQGILGGIDDVLAELKVLCDDAGPEALRALEGVRHALVKEAIDLTEALQQVAPAELVEEITTSRKARRGSAAAVTRMVRATEAFDDGPRQVPWGLVVVLVLAVIGAAAYHGFRFVTRTRSGAADRLRSSLRHGGNGHAAGQGGGGPGGRQARPEGGRELQEPREGEGERRPGDPPGHLRRDAGQRKAGLAPRRGGSTAARSEAMKKAAEDVPRIHADRAHDRGGHHRHPRVDRGARIPEDHLPLPHRRARPRDGVDRQGASRTWC